MSGTTTTRMNEAYYQDAEPTAFFTGMFRSPPENFHSSEEIEFDVVRSDDEVSIVVQALTSDYRMNTADIYTNKKLKPPIHMEAIPIESGELIKRMPGQNPFETPDFRGNLVLRMFQGMRLIERKIRRSIELQASQVLQTGIITLTDIAGTPLYTLDYKPKAAHFPTAGTSWASASLAQKIADIQSLCEAINTDSRLTPDQIHIGEDAFENLIQTAGFSDIRFDSRRVDTGAITPMQSTGNGGIRRGVIEVGNYRLDVFAYNGGYIDPQSQLFTKYLDKGKVLIRASAGRLDATFGAIPDIGRLLNATSSLLPELPDRFSSPGGGMDLFTNVWLSQDGRQLFGGIGSRPLMIPTAIDSFGCLDTQL